MLIPASLVCEDADSGKALGVGAAASAGNELGQAHLHLMDQRLLRPGTVSSVWASGPLSLLLLLRGFEILKSGPLSGKMTGLQSLQAD